MNYIQKKIYALEGLQDSFLGVDLDGEMPSFEVSGEFVQVEKLKNTIRDLQSMYE